MPKSESPRVGVVLPIAHDEATGAPPPYAQIRELALQAEAAGFDSAWVFDHLLFRFDGETAGIHECWTILSALAEATSRIELGTLVMCTAFRNPALLAKMAAAVDHVSGGRLILGLGAGWHDPEFEAFGYPTDHKVSRFEESLQIIHGLIRDGRVDLEGRYHQARDAVLLPPARRDLPILIASARPRMHELAARYADAWNGAWHGLPDEKLRGRRAGLGEAMAKVGRDPASLSVTVGINVRYDDLAGPLPDDADTSKALRGTPEEIAVGLQAHVDEGADHLIVALDPATPAALERLTAAVARFREGRAAGPAGVVGVA